MKPPLLQAKRHQANIGGTAVDRMIAVLERERCSEGVLVTTSDFTPAARRSAEQHRQNLVLVNGVELVDKLAQHGVGIQQGRFGELLWSPPAA